jgi:hypothetical protein
MSDVMSREDMIDYLKGFLKGRWQEWGLEIVNTADTILKYQERREIVGEFKYFANKSLYNAILRSKMDFYIKASDRIPIYYIPDSELPTSQIPENNVLLMIDMKKKLDQDIIDIGIQKHVHGKTRSELSKEFNLTDKTLRGKLNKFNQYVMQYRGLENV